MLPRAIAVTHAVTAVAAAQAPEVAYLNRGNRQADGTTTRRAQVYLVGLGAATGATVRLQGLRVGGDPAVDADWVLLSPALSAVGLGPIVEVLGMRCRVVAISNGVAGSVVSNVFYENVGS
jgi:hypothetical protein